MNPRIGSGATKREILDASVPPAPPLDSSSPLHPSNSSHPSHPSPPPSTASSADLIQRTLPIAMLSLALIAVPILVLQPEGLPRLRALQTELSGANAQNDDLRREIARLRVEVRTLRDDPAAVERIARGELGMVRKSEVVFQFGK
jgi:cell division protein FtsB